MKVLIRQDAGYINTLTAKDKLNKDTFQVPALTYWHFVKGGQIKPPPIDTTDGTNPSLDV